MMLGVEWLCNSIGNNTHSPIKIPTLTHTESACFHLAEWQEQNWIILPGNSCRFFSSRSVVSKPWILHPQHSFGSQSVGSKCPWIRRISVVCWQEQDLNTVLAAGCADSWGAGSWAVAPAVAAGQRVLGTAQLPHGHRWHLCSPSLLQGQGTKHSTSKQTQNCPKMLHQNKHKKSTCMKKCFLNH